jgi:2,3-bisphosphoglycerate-independent phosphoglycerate mutase
MTIPGFLDYKVSCSHATEHRCGLRVSGPDLSYHITGQDPLKDNKPMMKVEPTIQNDEKAQFTARLTQALSDEITVLLLKHPINLERKKQGLPYANMLTLRGCGQRL